MRRAVAMEPEVITLRPMSKKKINAIMRIGVKSDAGFRQAIRMFEAELKKNAAREAEIRLRWRKEHELVYVKQYTVKAHMRKLNRKRTPVKPGKLVRLLLPGPN